VTAPPVNGAGEASGIVPSGFFVLRTPLLPFDERRPCDEAEARERLRSVLSRPEVREALFVASPDLEERLEDWEREPESARGRKVEPALVRYVARMAGRATPFGLFAGHSVGLVGERTQLEVAPLDGVARHTRLDLGYLDALQEALARDPAIREELTFRPNSSLYRLGDRVRYVEVRVDGDKRRTHHVVGVRSTRHLDAALARAALGARPPELAGALVASGASEEGARRFVAELIDAQVLVSDLELAVTGREPLAALIEQLRSLPAASEAVGQLEAVADDLAALDRSGLGSPSAHYRDLARRLEGLPAQPELPRLVQVDLLKPAARPTLGKAVIDEIARGIELLHRSAVRSAEPTELERFRDAFAARYEEREVRLLEVLDPEQGLGWGGAGELSDGGPLLRGLPFPSEPKETARWGARERLLLRKLGDALRSGADEIVLDRAEVDALAAAGEPKPLPDALAALAVVAARSQADLDAGRFRVLLPGADGPSGATLLGRFCHGDPELSRHVREHLAAEELHAPDAIYAELVHLPEGRLGNVLCRPVLRDYELPYLGRSEAPPERQISADDLTISVRDGRIELRSIALGKRVIPRLTSAHNYRAHGRGLYRFLCLLQDEGRQVGLGFEWAALADSPFLPRVVSGRLVLAKARWRLDKLDLAELRGRDREQRREAVQELRARRGLPELVALADSDNVLPVDLDNPLSVDAFAAAIAGRDEAIVVEQFPGPDELCAEGPEGRFVHELVVPFVRTPVVASANGGASWRGRQRPIARSFAPGSEWLYAKLYTGPATADDVLRDVVEPLVARTMEAGAADRWFFIRYNDPGFHLRLRFHGDPAALHEAVLPDLEVAVAPLLADGHVRSLVLDTYEREVERYGGQAGIEAAERLFSIDSDAALGILCRLESGDAGADERWRIALAGADRLVRDLGLDEEARLRLWRELRAGYGHEFRVDGALTGKLGERFRKERASLEALLDADGDDGPLAPGLRVLDRRSDRLAPLGEELAELDRSGELAAPLERIAASYVHMHLNRLLRAAARANELVIYDFLARLYVSRTARLEAVGR
jgi:class I lanthipeptide synthase